MRTRLVVWGSDPNDQKVLLGISLLADDNKIELFVIPARDCTEELYNQMMNEWREGADLQLPISTEKRTLELTMSQSILPEDFRVERSDAIQRAQMEWHFLVLSTKLYRNFKSELEEMSDKVKRLEAYDKTVWEDLKSLWDTIQKHTFDKNIIRDHADSLREKSNAIFDELKKLRSTVEQELVVKSAAILESFNAKIEEIRKRIQAGGVLKLIFDDLKKIQEEFKSQNLVKDDRSKISKSLDEAFNAVREKRSAGSSNTGPGRNDKSHGALDRFNARLDGLEQALKKIEKSIEFDQKDIDFENKRIASSTGQLEAQIRVAKIKMIEDRINSKKEKLEELLKIKSQLLKTSEILKKKEEKRVKKQDEKEHQIQEEKKVKAKYEEEIQHKHVEPGMEEKLLKAAEEIKAGKRPRKSLDHTEDEIKPSDSEKSPASDTEFPLSPSEESTMDEFIQTSLDEETLPGSVSETNLDSEKPGSDSELNGYENKLI